MSYPWVGGTAIFDIRGRVRNYIRAKVNKTSSSHCKVFARWYIMNWNFKTKLVSLIFFNIYDILVDNLYSSHANREFLSPQNQQSRHLYISPLKTANWIREELNLDTMVFNTNSLGRQHTYFLESTNHTVSEI